MSRKKRLQKDLVPLACFLEGHPSHCGKVDVELFVPEGQKILEVWSWLL